MNLKFISNCCNHLNDKNKGTHAFYDILKLIYSTLPIVIYQLLIKKYKDRENDESLLS